MNKKHGKFEIEAGGQNQEAWYKNDEKVDGPFEENVQASAADPALLSSEAAQQPAQP